jgi:hypothetical protein
MFPMTCLAKFGWSFSDYSILAGQQYRFGQRPLWNFEFQFDKYSSSCLHQSHYFGIGLNYSFNENQTELGLKGMFNPTHFKIMVSRTIKFYPYLFGQGNFIKTKYLDQITNESKQISNYGFRPGLGLTGNIREDKVLSIRLSLQVGYNISFDNSQSLKNSLTFEFKVGFGINSRRLSRNKRIEEGIKQEEVQ